MYRFVKRMFDVIMSLTGIVVLSPVMLIVAIAVKIDSKGPAIFATKRIGKDGKEFPFYKFRSMRTDAPKDCATALLDSEKYITKVGRFIRKTSLDELPQLFCILKGDMSLIGYRPGLLSEAELNYKREQAGIYAYRPGLTGWAQVNGRDVTAADIDKKVAYDMEYSNNLSAKLDLKIFFMTIKKVLTSDGIVEGKNVNTIVENDKNLKNEPETVSMDSHLNSIPIDSVDMKVQPYVAESEIEKQEKKAS